jgi:thiamine biosynthesis protein ThiI
MRLLALISGGIDSPVAVHLMLAKGDDVDLLHFDNRPFTDDKPFEKVKGLARTISASVEGVRRPRLMMAPHGKVQIAIARGAIRRLGCVLCRRMMFHVASALAERNGYDALVTGESLGQVASQTLMNIRAEEPAATVPVLRPLIGLDKLEIIAIAERIGTFATSIEPGLCCTIVPEKPATKARLKDVLAAENGLDMAALIKQELDGIQEVDYRCL